MTQPAPPPGMTFDDIIGTARGTLADPARMGAEARAVQRSTGALPLLTNSTPPDAQATPSAQNVPSPEVAYRAVETAWLAATTMPPPSIGEFTDETGFFDEASYDAAFELWSETPGILAGNLKDLGKAVEFGGGETAFGGGSGKGGGGGGGGSAGYVYDPNVAINAINQYNMLLNELDLTEYKIDFERTDAENNRMLDEFRAKLDKFAGKVTFDQLNLSRNAQELGRFAETRSENRQRADDVQSAIQAVLPYVGKEQYTSRELGASFETLARIAGQDPDAPIRVGTGTAHINPLALLGALDTRTGTAGAPPVVPGLATRINDVPNAPTLNQFPEPPFPLRRPQAPYTGPPMIMGAYGGDGGGGGAVLPNGVPIKGNAGQGALPGTQKGAGLATPPPGQAIKAGAEAVKGALPQWGNSGGSSQPATASPPLKGYLDTVAGPPAPGPMGPPLPPPMPAHVAADPSSYIWDGQRWVLR